MKIKIRKKKRKFLVGIKKKIYLNDVGKIYLDDNELITFVTKNLSKHDVVKKDWGFYATQSLNSRLKKRFKTALVINPLKRIFVMLVEKKFMKKFKNYCKQENQIILCWLDEI
jgi:hypothetical protein